MDERLEEIKGEQFADLEQAKIDILKEKLYLSLQEFEENQGQQWTGLRFEKPLLTKLLSLIQQAEKVPELEDEIHLYKLRKENAQELNEIVIKPLQEENQRYKEALEFYAKDDIRGEKARRALRGESK